ncbi:YggT family protein [Rhodanobacter ginsengiterrae]|uniref:YggT family protein n=1 Tax=Rhodanobacter ginsengiterrae TaxID=2008451 RepID=UPI003CECEFF9
MSYLLNAVSMLIELAFEAAVTLLLLRVAAEACRADFHNPLSQLIYRYTNPVLAPIRRVLPNWRRINLSALLLAWLAMLLKRVLLFALLGVMRTRWACSCCRWPNCSISPCCSIWC